MDTLNYHHLRYFREVARDGNLTRTAGRVNLSQSALSTQIRTLEARLGHPLFDRVGRRLVLTETGRVVLDHADRIFGTGEELLATLAGAGAGAAMPPLRVGALSTLSRNFKLRFLRPVLGAPDIDIVLKSGGTEAMMAALTALSLDVVLTTEPPRGDGLFTVRRLAAQTVGVHGLPQRLDHPDLPALLSAEAFIVPTESSIRAGFLSLAERLGVVPRIAADVDDMAMVRLLAREGAGLAIAPAVVLADEIASGMLATAPFDLDIVETFHAVTIRRRFPHPALAMLLDG